MSTATTHTAENVIIADADYLDKVAFNLTVNFERVINRPIPKADLARWTDCIALDGGLREGRHQTTVVLVHDRHTKEMKNFVPSHFDTELNATAFSDHLGEFTFSACHTEDMASSNDFIADIIQTAASQPAIKRIMAVPNGEESLDKVTQAMRQADLQDKRATLFTMQPMAAGGFRTEILGFSVMAALGIKSEEITAHTM